MEQVYDFPLHSPPAPPDENGEVLGQVAQEHDPAAKAHAGLSCIVALTVVPEAVAVTENVPTGIATVSPSCAPVKAPAQSKASIPASAQNR